MKRTQVVTLPKRMRYGPRYVQPAHLPVPSTEIVAMFFFPRRPFPAGVASISPTSSAYISVSEATTVAEERGLGGTKEKKTTAQRCIRTQRLRISKVAESEGDGLGYLYFCFFYFKYRPRWRRAPGGAPVHKLYACPRGGWRALKCIVRTTNPLDQ